ncbi:phosphoenolpyruvate synthase [Prauserella marina]|uniref:Rifampicin phosphotransferase n=1 Tax=Prauserella marina TaxID=530584 RepID=A0A222VKS3_9PSEU|nr:rifamycin-inactivating phosphotransferase [Prauserella marina]ASR34484.1 phosphoenolpyruvate synthase [Prauserella marina]PWV85919.1 pyruvate,water dikinase [Prauserella marina]SDC42335.1 pyruvate, water dikinase [Prauserella marina]
MLPLEGIGTADVADVGGKAAHLGELSRIEGIHVPRGFCVTTEAFSGVMAGVPSIEDQLGRLSRVDPADRAAIAALSADIRRTVEGAALPAALVAEISEALAPFGERAAFAVRSSATAEDLPTASFAGQQDSYLNVVGADEVILRIRRCWASLFTARAVTYRLRNGFGQRSVRMAVVVQRMVFPDAAGILFTADPVTSNRKVATVGAAWGLGEALVSGTASGDVYTVRDDEVVGTSVATKRVAVRAVAGGGTERTPVEPERRTTPVLTDEQAVRLVRLGRRAEAHFGGPQDIEWCIVDNEFHIVQSRAITTLFPLPVIEDEDNHVYVSVGHQQMMTDAMKPLGLSMWLLTTMAEMHEAGGRLFVDVAPLLATRKGREGLLGTLGRSDPLTRDALRAIVERGDFVPSLSDGADNADDGRALPGTTPSTIETDPAIVRELITSSEDSIATLRREIEPLSGPALFDFVLADIAEMKRILFDPRSNQAIAAAMEATLWLNDNLGEWLGEKNAADVLSQSVSHNVTSEMGLALLDVADVIRPHADVVAFLRKVADEEREGERFLGELEALEGGSQVREAIAGFLTDYGMRCPGEIDITRTRWSERPSMLVPMILGNVANFEPGESKRRFELGLEEARRKEQELLTRLRAVPDGEDKAERTKRMIDRIRTFAGYREYPKYSMISRYFCYKRALLREARRLVEAGVLRAEEDVFYLKFQEFHDIARTGKADGALIEERGAAFRSYEALMPPRVVTSDGEVIVGEYRHEDLPEGALAGLPVSAGVVEGRARVVVDMAKADLRKGDILVTSFTDPSWTPLFVAVDGLVTELGGLMTHGAVIAREYGLPAVVGVARATRSIKDGQRIQVNGTEGYVRILD